MTLVRMRIVRGAIVSGFADYRAIYTWRSWLFGWLARVLSQVAFFALIGRLVGGQTAAYVLIGNAVAVAALESCMAVSSSTWERRAGTLPLLVAAPASP